MCNNAVRPQPGGAALSGSLGPRCLRPVPARPAPSPPALRNRPARTSPPSMGPVRPTGPACGPVTLSSDKTHPLFATCPLVLSSHCPASPRAPTLGGGGSVCGLISPRPRRGPRGSRPWCQRAWPMGLAGLPRPSHRPRSVQNWFLWPGFDPWASDCSAGFGRQSSAAPPQGPSRHPSVHLHRHRGGGPRLPWAAALPVTAQSSGRAAGALVPACLHLRTLLRLQATRRLPSGGPRAPSGGAGLARFTLNGAEARPSSVRSSFFVRRARRRTSRQWECEGWPGGARVSHRAPAL